MSAPTASNEWTPCHPGEIGGMVTSLKQRQRRKTVVRAAGVTSIVIVLAAVLTGVLGRFSNGNPIFEEIACQRVLELAPQYVAHQLDEGLHGQIDLHLERCKHCRDEIHARFPNVSLPNEAAGITPRDSHSVLGAISQ